MTLIGNSDVANGKTVELMDSVGLLEIVDTGNESLCSGYLLSVEPVLVIDTSEICGVTEIVVGPL